MFDCVVGETLGQSTHTVFFGDVVGVSSRLGQDTLLYGSRKFRHHRLEQPAHQPEGQIAFGRYAAGRQHGEPALPGPVERGAEQSGLPGPRAGADHHHAARAFGRRGEHRLDFGEFPVAADQ